MTKKIKRKEKEEEEEEVEVINEIKKNQEEKWLIGNKNAVERKKRKNRPTSHLIKIK